MKKSVDNFNAFIAISTFIVISPIIFANANSLTALQVIQKMDQRYDGDSSVSSRSMILIDKGGSQRLRNLRVYQKDYGDDSKSIIFFESPADIKGTAYLAYDWQDENRDDDSWLYLPALQKVKRIAAGGQSGSFLGSDFTFSDLNGLEIGWYNYQFINESDEVGGEECWVIEITPKPEYVEKVEKKTGYIKTNIWIRKDNFIQVKSKIWVKNGKKIKYFSASDIKLIDGIWTPTKLQMVTTYKNTREHASVFLVNDITYNKNLNDNLFETETMLKGFP